MMTWQRIALCSFALGGAATLAGCYSAEFDPNANEVFACYVDDDCGGGSICVDGICIVDEGPQIEITGPEFLSAIDDVTTTVEITLKGSGLTLVPPGEGTGAENEGYIEVFLDGNKLLSAEESSEISSGSLTTGIVTQPLLIPDVTRSVHRLVAVAVDPDGVPYKNGAATARSVFFSNVTDDLFTSEPFKPQVAVLEPWPGDEIPSTEDVTVAIGATNWTWKPPVAMLPADGKAAPNATKEGHTHIYFNLDEETVGNTDSYPNCLPTCNLAYTTTFNPNSAPTENPKILRGDVGIAEEFATGETLDIRVGLQWNDHIPYPAVNAKQVDWDAGFDDGAGGTFDPRQHLVNDQIEVRLRQP